MGTSEVSFRGRQFSAPGLEGFGDPISAQTLSALKAGKSGFHHNVPAKVFRDAALSFIALLENRTDLQRGT